MSERPERDPEGPGEAREADPAQDPGPRENPEPDEGMVEEGEDQLDQVSGN